MAFLFKKAADLFLEKATTYRSIAVSSCTDGIPEL